MDTREFWERMDEYNNMADFYRYERNMDESEIDDRPVACDWPGCGREATLHESCPEHFRMDASIGLLELSRGTQDLHPATRAALRLCAKWIRDDCNTMFSDCCAVEDWEAALKGELK